MQGVDKLIYYIILLAICLLLSAFFSSAETAFISLQKTRLQHEVNTKVKGAERVLKIIRRPDKFLSTVLLGNNLVNTAFTAMATSLTIILIGDREEAIVVATIGVTIVLLIFGESIPKTIGAHHAERLSKFYARLIEWLSWILTPFVWVLSWIASAFARIAGGKLIPRSLATEEEIRTMITVGESEGAVEEAEAEMLHNIFEFTDRLVRAKLWCPGWMSFLLKQAPKFVISWQYSRNRHYLAILCIKEDAIMSSVSWQ